MSPALFSWPYFFVLGMSLLFVGLLYVWRLNYLGQVLRLEVPQRSLNLLGIGWLHVGWLHVEICQQAKHLFPRFCELFEEHRDLRAVLQQLESEGHQFDQSIHSLGHQVDILCYLDHAQRTIRIVGQNGAWHWRILIAQEPTKEYKSSIVVNRRCVDLTTISLAMEKRFKKKFPRFCLVVIESLELAPSSAELCAYQDSEYFGLLQSRLTACTKAGDILAYLSNNQHLMLLENVGSADEARKTVQRIMRAVSQKLITTESSAQPLLFMGIALAPVHGHCEEQLLSAAQSACAHARVSGDSVCLFGPQVQDRRRVELLNYEYSESMARLGQFQLWFQPVTHQHLDGVCAMEMKPRLMFNRQHFSMLPLLELWSEQHLVKQLLMRFWQAFFDQLFLFEHRPSTRLMVLVELPLYVLQINRVRQRVLEMMRNCQGIELVLCVSRPVKHEHEALLDQCISGWRAAGVDVAVKLPQLALAQLDALLDGHARYVHYDLQSQPVSPATERRIAKLASGCQALGLRLILRNPHHQESVQNWFGRQVSMLTNTNHYAPLCADDAADYFQSFDAPMSRRQARCEPCAIRLR